MMHLAAAGSLTRSQIVQRYGADLWVLAWLNGEAPHRRACGMSALTP